MTLFIVCGHGAGDSGAVGGGYNEADLVRRLADRMKELAPDDVEVLDKSINWYASKRVNQQLKNLVGNNPVIELHMDSGASNARGGHVIIKAGHEPDKFDYRLAESISRLFSGRSETIVKRDNLYNINQAARLGINYRLLEVCFISNDADRNLLINNMDEVAEAILNSFGIEGGNMPSPQEVAEAVWNFVQNGTKCRDRLQGIDEKTGQLVRNDDPTGRGKNGVGLYDRVLFMAKKQEEIQVELDETKKLLEEIKKAVTE